MSAKFILWEKMPYKSKRLLEQEAKIRSKTFFDPTYDIVFKEIFSKKETLIHFLNAILHLEDEAQIVSVEERKPTVTLDTGVGEEQVRFDVHAKTKCGKFIDLEMQRASHEDFLDRVELYGSLLSINSKIDMNRVLLRESQKSNSYTMPTVYSIWLCNFSVEFCNSYHEEIGLYRASDVGNRGALPIYGKKKYILIDLTKFKADGKCSPEMEWLKLFTTMADAKETPQDVDEVLKDVYERMLVAKSSNLFISEVAQGMVTEAEIMTRIGTAHRTGFNEGALDAKKKMAKQMLLEGLDQNRIARISGLSEAEIRAL